MANKVLVDKINDAFISIMVQENSKAYANYIKSINREFIDNIETLDASKVKSIIRNQKLNISDVALLFAIQNAVLLILNDRQEARKNPNLLPIIAVMAMYKVTKPQSFVKKIVKISKSKGLNTREQSAFQIITEFKKENATVLRDARQQALKNMQQSINKSKVSKRMLRDLRQGIKEKKSIKQIKDGLVKKYNKLSNIERALDTELHAQSEYVRLEHSKALGYTHKQWRTQNDERVRKTCFHTAIANKVVPINSDFRACGMVAQYPSDERLPPNERIRCRCYTIQIKK